MAQGTTADQSLGYLFSPRLNFLSSQEQITSNCKVSGSPLAQTFSQKKLHQPQPCDIQVKTNEDITQLYEAFYNLIHHCRFDKKNVEETSTASKQEIKKRKTIKDIEDQRKSKIKKILVLLGLSQKNYQNWKDVLNHKNLFSHITKARFYLKAILEKNFELIEQGTANVKNSQIPLEVQIKLCILVMDIITLINTMKYMFNPFTESDSLVSKLIQEQTAFFDQALQKISQNEKLNVVNSLNTKVFYESLKFLVAKLPAEQHQLKLWFDLEEIRQRFMVEETGIMRHKPIDSYKKKIESRMVQNVYIPFQISEVQLQWLNVYNQHVLVNKETISQDFSEIFKEYQQFFNFYIDEMIRKQETGQKNKKFIEEYIGDYSVFMRNIWPLFDKDSAEKLFINEMREINNKFKLPLEFIRHASEPILQMIDEKIEEFKENKNDSFLKKLQMMGFELSQKLLGLQSNDDLIGDYFIVLQKGVKNLLRERSDLDYLFEQIYNYKNNIQLNEFFDVIKKIQKIIEDNQLELKVKNPFYQQKDESSIIKSLYETYESESQLIDEVKYFLKTFEALTKVEAQQEDLLISKEFYSKKKLDLFNPDKTINKQKLCALRYGLLDFIRFMIYELILKVKLKFDAKELDRDQKFLYKLLKFYQNEKEKSKKQIQDKCNELEDMINQTDDDQELDEETKLDLQISELLLKKIQSQQIDLESLKIQSQSQIETDSNLPNQFALNFLKKIYELRLEIIHKNIKELELKQKPLEKDYIYMKNVIYTSAIKSGQNNFLKEELSELAKIQYLFIKKRQHRAWRMIKSLKRIEQIKDLLQKVWTKDRNLLKIHIKLFLKYQEIYYNSKLIANRNDISDSEVTHLIDEVLKEQTTIINSRNIEETKEFIEQLKASVKILDRVEKVEILRRQIQQRDEEKRSLQDAKTYELIDQKNQFQALDGKLKIYRFEKHGAVIMRKYIITCPANQVRQIEKRLKMLTKLNLNNINIEVKELGKIQMVVDEVQNQFDSYPKLVRYLIEAYYRVIVFCKNQMEFKLNPVLTRNDFEIILKEDRHYSLKINPYEGILINILLSYEELKRSGIFKYPKHPFVPFSDQLSMKFKAKKIYNQIAPNKLLTTEEYGFWHLVDEMRAISLENYDQEIGNVVQKILKCPYFWSSTQKSFELVEFKERYHSMVNIEESRRKTNERTRRSLCEQEQEKFTFEPLHPLYKKSYGYSKTAQMYFSFEGLIQKRAFLEDIGNFRSNGNHQEFRLQNYDWSSDNGLKQKQEINRLIKMVSKRQRKKGSRNSNFHKKSFPSFHMQIRNLRNLLSHYLYDEDNKKQITLEYKLQLIEKSFPKLFVFIYRWKPFLGKNFEQIQATKVEILLRMFKNKDKNEVIERLMEIKQFWEYNKIDNRNRKKLFQLFKYDFDNRNECKACNILCILFHKKISLWDMLSDYDDPNAMKKEGKEKENPPYNYLFYEHRGFACNGMQFLLPFFVNTMRRDNFTSEEAAQLKSTITSLRLQIQKLDRKIENLQDRGYKEDDLFSENSSYTSDEQKCVDKKDTMPVEKRCQLLSNYEREQLFEEMYRTDYVNKNTIYHFELLFPFFFDDIRRERYRWDIEAREFEEEEQNLFA